MKVKSVLVITFLHPSKTNVTVFFSSHENHIFITLLNIGYKFCLVDGGNLKTKVENLKFFQAHGAAYLVIAVNCNDSLVIDNSVTWDRGCFSKNKAVLFHCVVVLLARLVVVLRNFIFCCL